MENNKEELVWLTDDQKDATLEAAIARFPEEFGLRAFRGDKFRISRSASYFQSFFDINSLMLYTERLCEDGEWKDFCKGTETELRREVSSL